MKIVRARSKYGAEKEYVSNKTGIRRIIRQNKATESSGQVDIQFVIKDGGVSRVWEFEPENIETEDFNKLVDLGILPIENGVGFVIFNEDGSIDFSDFEPTNEALPRQQSVDQLKRVMKMSAKTDIGNRISDMNKQGSNIQYIQNPIDSGIESYEDFEKHNKKFIPSWNLKHLLNPFSGESKKNKYMKHIKIFENFYDQQMRDEQENASKNIKTENSEIKVGTLGVDGYEWSVYSRDVWGEEYPVTEEQMEIFNSDPYNFDDKKVKFQLVDGKAVVKLKQVTKYEVE